MWETSKRVALLIELSRLDLAMRSGLGDKLGAKIGDGEGDKIGDGVESIGWEGAKIGAGDENAGDGDKIGDGDGSHASDGTAIHKTNKLRMLQQSNGSVACKTTTKPPTGMQLREPEPENAQDIVSNYATVSADAHHKDSNTDDTHVWRTEARDMHLTMHNAHLFFRTIHDCMWLR